MNVNIPRDYVCRICNIPGHWIQHCPSKRSSMQKPPPNYICKICNIPGHWIQQCPNKNSCQTLPPFNYICKKCHQKGHWIQQCSLKYSIPPKSYVCNICHIAGHWIQQCPQRRPITTETNNSLNEQTSLQSSIEQKPSQIVNDTQEDTMDNLFIKQDVPAIELDTKCIDIKRPISMIDTSFDELLSSAVKGYILNHISNEMVVAKELIIMIGKYLKNFMVIYEMDKFWEIMCCRNEFKDRYDPYAVISWPPNQMALSKYMFDDSKCINCLKKDCLRFVKWYRDTEVTYTDPIKKSLRIDYQRNVREYQCKLCRIYIGYNLIAIAYKRGGGGCVRTTTFTPIGDIEEADKKMKNTSKIQSCDKCKTNMKWCGESHDEWIRDNGDADEYSDYWYCDKCQLFCETNRYYRSW